MKLSTEEIQRILSDLPEKPGVYRYYDIDRTLIYVGKAKDIRKRVSSYFQRFEVLDGKTRKLVTQIREIEYTLVNTEFDALLLENSLIKKHQPKYNIQLKDDKTFPYIYVSDEAFPRLLTTRRLERELGTFYGPYTSVKSMEVVVEFLHKLFHLRTCSLSLTEKNISEKKFKVCLEYHMGNCKAPCVGLENDSAYEEKIKQVHHILKGNLAVVRNHFKEEMQKAAQDMDFERAQQLKENLERLDSFQSKSVVVNPSLTDLDVFAIVSDEKIAVVNYFKIINGSILQTKTLEMRKKLEESDAELLELAIAEIRDTQHEPAKEILTNVALDIQAEHLVFIVPKIGDKKKLVDMSQQNATHRLIKLRNDNVEDESKYRVLRTLQADLRLKELPDHIECFDNSNFHGTDAVAAMVCFKGGKPSKRDYRHFNIKTVEGPNDFASMHEIITRRYNRCLEENLPLPKLIVVDGGKGQLSSACDALKALGLYGQIPIIGIAKNLEELFFPGDEIPLYLDKKSESLRLIQYLRDEAHRFGITHHRNKRSKTSIHSKLQTIEGVGEQSMQKLLKAFRSVAKIQQATLEELAAVVGESKARTIKTHFDNISES